MKANILLSFLAIASFMLVNQVFAIQPGPNRALGWHTKISKELHQKRQLQLEDEKRSINRFNRRNPPPPPGGPPAPPPPPPTKNGVLGAPPPPPPPPPSAATVILNGTVTQPLDHFGSTSNLTFQQRYWYSLKHYKPNSGKPTPIYVLDSGEVDASTRLGYLDHGILDILAGATNGIGVVLEHRYYGASYPNRSAFGPGNIWTVDQLQWLNLDQALEDNAQFVQKMTFQGVAEPQSHFQAPNAPVISYGGSYPGAKSAILRVKYPNLFWGSLASSAVIVAKEEFPEYYWPVYDGTQTDCAQAILETIQYVDNIIAPDPQLGQKQTRRDPVATKQLMDLFGAGDLTNVADFANMLTFPLDYFQDLNWDPSVSFTQFPNFCTQLVGHASGNVSPAPQKRQQIAGSQVPQVVQNYANYIKSYWIQGQCTSQGFTVPQCYASGNYAYYNDNTVLESEISWTFQTCTQFGYRFTAGPVVETSNSPLDFTLSGPKMLSALLDLDYASQICQGAFPPGKTFQVPAHPDINAVNKYGGYNIASNRLAFINGQFDPWRPATTASTEYANGGNRIDSLDTPFKLIPNCWHHCDSNGAANNGPEPPRIQAIHSQEIQFVQQWLSEWPAH